MRQRLLTVTDCCVADGDGGVGCKALNGFYSRGAEQGGMDGGREDPVLCLLPGT